jgi:uncharacterized protein (TIGR03435 family)
MSLRSLAGALALPLHTIVVDESNTRGMYSISLSFAPLDDQDRELPSIFSAVRDTLGLRLVSEKLKAPTLVIDHINRHPTDN